MAKNKKKYFNEGDDVAHKENLELKMSVKKIVKKKKMVTVAGKEEKEEKDFMVGIICGWWKDKEYKQQLFHTRELIPWDVATKGEASAIRWLEEN